MSSLGSEKGIGPALKTRQSYARATLAKRAFVVNPTFVKFDRNLLYLC